MSLNEHTDVSLRAAWLQDVGSLPDDDLLALAYSFAHSAERLRIYLELFRGRAGLRAQFAACLICFDLAQKGDAAMAAQFAFLQGTLMDLAKNQNLASELVGQHAYLCALWAQCHEALKQSSTPEAQDAPGTAEAFGFLRAQDAPLAGSIDLLTDDDLSPEALEVDEAAMWRVYVQGCEQFFGAGAHLATYDGSMGFRLRGHHGQARAHSFDLALEHCQRFVAPARGMRPLLLMAWGLSLKSRGLLGQPNKRRQHLLIEGLMGFVQATPEVTQVAQVMGPLYADVDTWPQIAMFVAQYAQYLREWRRESKDRPLDYRATIETFVTDVMPH